MWYTKEVEVRGASARAPLKVAALASLPLVLYGGSRTYPLSGSNSRLLVASLGNAKGAARGTQWQSPCFSRSSWVRFPYPCSIAGECVGTHERLITSRGSFDSGTRYQQIRSTVSRHNNA